MGSRNFSRSCSDVGCMRGCVYFLVLCASSVRVPGCGGVGAAASILTEWWVVREHKTVSSLGQDLR